MSFLHHFGFISLIVVGKVFSQPSCSTEKNFSKNKEETSCINLGLSVLPLSDIPPSTAILNLPFNNFKSLSTSAFKGLKQLTELDVSDNGMTSFTIDISLMLEELNLANNSMKLLPKVDALSGLTTLVLSNNMISTIPQNAFKGLKKLTRLELQHNSITSLEEEVFADLLLLRHLDLSYNQLRYLPDHLLSNTVDLEILYLSGNRLTDIPDNFFGELELTYVFLEKNDWNCNCALMYFKEWLEADEGRIYETSKVGPTRNQRSVVCSKGIPLVDFDLDHCLIRKKGDMDINSIPVNTIQMLATSTPTTQATTTLPTSTPTTQATTTLPTSTPTAQATTTLPTSTPTTQSTTTLPTSTPATQATTTLPTSTPTTQATTTLPTSTPTTQATIRTTVFLKTSPRTTVWTTTKPYPTELMMTTSTEEPSTTLFMVSTTDIVSTNEGSTSEETVKVSTMSPTDEPYEIPVNTILPARSSAAAAFSMNWLEKVILENCCLLHVIIYGLCIFLLLVWMVITTGCLLWIFCCNQDLVQWLPGIRLIRYSMRAPMSDEDILLVNNGAIESHFRDQSVTGVTKMLVLESNTRKQEIRYTSAIL